MGYSVSPLHRVRYLDQSAAHEKPIVRGENPALDSSLEWRQRLQSKYAEQLGEGLSWDECSAFEDSEDVATGGDMRLHYVAAVLDQSGPAGLTHLIRPTVTSREEHATLWLPPRGWAMRPSSFRFGRRANVSV